MTVQTILNGIPADMLADSMDAMRQKPEMGKYKFRAKNQWIRGTYCTSAIKDFCAGGQEDTSREIPHMLEADEPAVLLGQDHGPNATETLLHALASCVSTAFLYHATAQGVHVDQLEFDVEGDIDLNGFLGLDDNVKSGYQSIRMTCRVQAEASMEKIKELCETAQKRSPVFEMVSQAVPISIILET
jgi:uncharacterized OsmC-like protein